MIELWSKEKKNNIVMSSTYTESHKLSYQKHKTETLQRMSQYYQQNKEELKRKRRARYASQKARALTCSKDRIDVILLSRLEPT
jgi:hypothetical protein